MDTPAITTLPGVTTAWTDLQAIHQQGTNTSNGDILHGVGQFLPWQRYFVAAHATALKDYCNYTGTFPWCVSPYNYTSFGERVRSKHSHRWDELKDANTGNSFQSNMWDSGLGFGGNGSSTDLCLRDGSFANRTISIGPLEALSPEGYCFNRQWNERIIQINGTSAIVDYCNAQTTYFDYWMCVFNGPHVAGHAGVGGTDGLVSSIYTVSDVEIALTMV
jgi:tyrosinase